MTLPETQRFVHSLGEQFLANEEQLMLQNIGSLTERTVQKRASELLHLNQQQKALEKQLETVKVSLDECEQEHLSLNYSSVAHGLAVEQLSLLERSLAQTTAHTMQLQKDIECAERELLAQQEVDSLPVVDDIGLRLKIYRSLGFDMQLPPQNADPIKCRTSKIAF